MGGQDDDNMDDRRSTLFGHNAVSLSTDVRRLAVGSHSGDYVRFYTQRRGDGFLVSLEIGLMVDKSLKTLFYPNFDIISVFRTLKLVLEHILIIMFL